MTSSQFDTMNDAALNYLGAEATAGIVFAVIGAIALISAFVFLIRSKKWGSAWRGAAWPVGILGIIQLAVGLSVAWSSSLQEGFLPWDQENPAVWVVTELERMEGVMKEFYILFVVEAVLITVSVVLLRRGRSASAPRETMVGVGAGLLVQTVAILIFDVLAAIRADAYLDVLRQATG